MGIEYAVGAGILGSGILGAGSSIFGASEQADATSQAAQTQSDMTKYGIDMQDKEFQQMLGLMNPFIQAGTGALPTLQKFASSDYTQNPLYQQQVKEGTSALRKAYAARGKVQSPEAMNAEGNLVNSLGSQYANQVYNYNIDLAKIGQQQAGTAGQMGMNMAGQQAGMFANLGNSLAQMQLQQGQTQAGMWGDIGSSLMGMGKGYMNYKMFQDIFPQLTISD
jgi:hypothetical protein